MSEARRPKKAPTRRAPSERETRNRNSLDWFLRAFAALIALVWGFVVMRSALRGVAVDPALHGIMGLTAGALFGVSLPWGGRK